MLDGNPPEDEQSVLQAMLGLAASIEADEWSNMTADEGVSRVHDALTHAHELVNQVAPEVEVEEQPTLGEDAPVLVAKGLVTPERSGELQYSAPTVDGDGGVEVHSEDGAPVRPAANSSSSDGGGSNRAARRSAQRRNKGRR